MMESLLTVVTFVNKECQIMSKKRHPKLFLSVMILAIVICSHAFVASASASQATPGTFSAAKVAGLEIPFIANQGQYEDDVEFYAQTFGGTVFVTEDGALHYALIRAREDERRTSVLLKETFVGGTIREIRGLEKSPTIVNYYIGSDPEGWRTNVPTFAVISLGELYEGIVVTLKAHGNNIEKLFRVAPGADPSGIRVGVSGAKSLAITVPGELSAETELGTATFTKPVAYQEIGGTRQVVEVAYALSGNEYGFALGAYDKSKELIIDPLLASTVLGGSGTTYGEEVRAIGSDSAGNIYVAGYHASSDFPTTPGAHDTTLNGIDGFVSCLSGDLTTLVASTFIGGSVNDYILDMAVEPATKTVWVAGYTYSTDFPTPGGAFTTNNSVVNSTEVFIARLNGATMALLSGTYLGGTNGYDGGEGGAGEHLAISYGKYGGVFVAGSTNSTDFTTTPGAYAETGQGGYDAFVSVFSDDLSTLADSTLFGGTNNDYVKGVDATEGSVYITGATYSINMPITTGTPKVGWVDCGVFIAHFDSDMETLLDSVILDGSADDMPSDMVVRSSILLVAGYTGSSDIPIHWADLYDDTPNGGIDVFVAKFLLSDLSYTGFTYIGGSGNDYAYDLTGGTDGVYLVGQTGSTNFPVTAGTYQTSSKGDAEVFVCKLSDSMEVLSPSTYIGGTNADAGRAITMSGGNVCIAGVTSSLWGPPIGYPTLPVGVYDELWGFPSGRGSSEAFISKFDAALSAGPADDPDIQIELSTTINIGDVWIGQTGAGWIRVRNVGRDYLNVGAVASANPLNSPFSKGTDTASGASIPPGLPTASDNYRIVYALFEPTTEGSFSDTFDVPSDDPDEPSITITVTGVGKILPAPVISVSPMSHGFGSVTVGNSSTALEITIANNGTDWLYIYYPMTLSDTTNYTLNLNGGSNPIYSLPYPLNVGESRTLTVTFNPTTAGPLNATLTIDHSDYTTGTPTVVTFSGTGIPVSNPEISVSPLSIDFGGVNVGNSSLAQNVQISNTGTDDLVISGMNLSDGVNFLLTGLTATTVAPGNSHSVSVTFRPTTTGELNASLTIYSNDADESTVVVPLVGEGLEQDISVSPMSHDFGAVGVGGSADITVRVTNDGTADLVLGTIDSLSPPFSIAPDACSGQTIQPGNWCEFTVLFEPSSEGEFTDSVQIPSDDPDEGTVLVNLIGDGAAAPVVVEEDLLPYPGQGIDDSERVPANTCIRARLTDETGIEFLVAAEECKTLITAYGIYAGPPEIEEEIIGTTIFREVQPGNSTDVWATFVPDYEGTYGSGLPEGLTVQVVIDACDTLGNSATYYDDGSFRFKVEESAAVLPTQTVVDPDPDNPGDICSVTLDEGMMADTWIEYPDTCVPAPYFGPSDEVPPLPPEAGTGYALPLNLQPPMVFVDACVSIFIPLPAATNLAAYDIWHYDPAKGWELAVVGDGWLEARINHDAYPDPGGVPTIELCINHFTGVQIALASSIGLSKTTINNTCEQGTNAASRAFRVWNSGTGTLSYTITDNKGWLSCSPTSGTSTGVDDDDVITVNYSTSSLAAGNYSGVITVSDPNAANNPQTISVSLTVTQPSITLSCVPDATILSRGGTLWYTVTATNNTATSQTFQYWTDVLLPNSTIYPPSGCLFGPVTVTLSAYGNRSARLSHPIPPVAPLGTYTFNACIGAYPTSDTEQHFNFEVR